ncbi:molybdopterin-guanine dinucleotide biosynthesis protein A [Luteibacter sp. UNCMF331Sha3.1]|uniref:molybdenum cofactor guanylyltransferase n=1 Tax=Luteibacter sp. UNCMF331Sha3.1 TaxID=1502760 RepID=UPI0008B0C848|nr:molybdenum cofactor guanylyltransferase [Luteibacter sp. UNCMF331Sha3.1]SEM38755.1 molybdopterin-guanine dinucleotide biosynthesis protein A [Luteibacter sp. UNCMF331Sha3.1]
MIVGLILAGGRSSRMGVDKSALAIDGDTMLGRTAKALRAAGADRVAISGTREGGIPDRWPGMGPIGGIASAALGLPDGEWLVVPVDMPRLGNAVLAPLLAERSLGATCWERHPLPMRLTMNAATRDALADLVTRPGRECSVSALQARLGATTLAPDGVDARLLINCNTPDDWREANA